MPARTTVKTPKKQQGLALLVLIIVIVLAFAAYSLSGLSVNQVKTDERMQTSLALNKAKAALLAYAVSFPEITLAARGPGYLPCPDLANNGKSTVNSCKTGGVANVGRLPWATIGSGDLRDGTGERLWYAVSENFDYSNSPTINKINTATLGTITLRNANGVLYNGASSDAVVAIIIAPGKALTRDDGIIQNRSTANVNDANHYLDIHVASTEDNATFQHNSTADGFINGEIKDAAGNVIVNDQIVVITYGEIMEHVHRRVARELNNLLNAYLDSCDAYPEASAFDPTKLSYDSDGLREGHLPLDSALPTDWGGVCVAGIAPVLPDWLKAEGWHKVTYYAFAYQNAPPANGSSCGNGTNPDCMTVNNTNPLVDNAQAILIFAGRDVSGNRPSTNISDYFEGLNNDLDDIYDAGEINDYISVVTP